MFQLDLRIPKMGIPKKCVLTIPEKECLNIRIDELAIKSESKQAKNKSSFLPCPFMWAATRTRGPDLGWVFLSQMIQSKVRCGGAHL